MTANAQRSGGSDRIGLPAGPRPAGQGLGRWARQRRPGWIAAGVALMALAVLTNVYLLQSAGRRVAVVRVARDVPVGQPLTRADLDTTTVALGPGVASIPARQLGEVVGRRAGVDLRRGTLLTASQVTGQLTPGPGQALVTVAFKAGQLPPHGLAPGSSVRVVPTLAGQGEQGVEPAASKGLGAAEKDVPATVDAVTGPDADGAMTVGLLVADAEADQVARLAAAGRGALVVVSRAGS